jgi:hypothetical protein
MTQDPEDLPLIQWDSMEIPIAADHILPPTQVATFAAISRASRTQCLAMWLTKLGVSENAWIRPNSNS